MERIWPSVGHEIHNILNNKSNRSKQAAAFYLYHSEFFSSQSAFATPTSTTTAAAATATAHSRVVPCFLLLVVLFPRLYFFFFFYVFIFIASIFIPNKAFWMRIKEILPQSSVLLFHSTESCSEILVSPQIFVYIESEFFFHDFNERENELSYEIRNP